MMAVSIIYSKNLGSQFSFFIIFFGGFTLLYKMEHVYLVIVRIYLVEFELHRDVRDG